MSLTHINGALNLLGQAETAMPLVAPRLPAGAEGPRLDVGWGEFHQGVGSNVQTLFARGAAKRFLSGGFFKDCWIESRWPRRAIVAALLWHVAFLAMPFPKGALGPKKVSGLENFQLTWSGPIQDLPLLEIPKARAKSVAKAAAVDPAPQPGADAFHPRQRIFTDPVRPTHAKQTLVNPKAPMEAPKLLPEMPNMVELAATTGPAKPKITISQDALKQMHPHERRVKLVKVAPPEDAPMMEQQPIASELNIPATENAPARPKLEINAGVAPRAARRNAAGEIAAAPAPEIGASSAAGGASAQTLIALSATPGPAAPAAPPAGNLAAKVSISPDGGKKGGSVDPNTGGGGKSPVGVSISGGNPPASKSGISGLGAGLGARSMRSLSARPQEPSGSEDEAVRVGPPDFKALPAGAKPEQVFVGKRVYTMNVNMPNLNSATGSWIMNFSELHRGDAGGPHITSTDLASPVVLKKVDPKYPPTMVAERVEGEVVLYAVIGKDGSVGEIQVVRGLEDLLDENSKSALAQWKFRPAMKAGEPVEVEVIAHIPFRIPPKE
ncbi:MAG TPA: energy transducer TonB [Candidatus Acidoferrum sp.]|jgi:TonB family protein